MLCTINLGSTSIKHSTDFARFKNLSGNEGWTFVHISDESMEQHKKYQEVYKVIQDRKIEGHKGNLTTVIEELDDREFDSMIQKMKQDPNSSRKRSILGDDMKDSIARMEAARNNNLMRSIV